MWNNELVKEVREGRLAIWNNGTSEELRELLKHCFPKDKYESSGVIDFYFASFPDSDTWGCASKTSLPSKSVKEFYMKEETKYTKEDWINGKIALEWENDKAEKINKFFKECNNQNTNAIGYARFYYSYNKNGIYHGTNKTNLPIVKIDDIMEEEQFPKDDFGVIVENNNSKEILDYLIKKGFDNKRQFTLDWLGNGWFVGIKYGIIWWESNKKEFSKIFNLEQLKNLDNMEIKKIIGYKLIKPEYSQAAERIANCSNWAAFESKLNELGWTKDTEEKLKKAGVLDIWFTPVYTPEKPKEVIVNMDSFELKVTKDGIYHKYENITQFVKELVEFYQKLPLKFDKYDCTVSNVQFIKVGCQTGTTLLNWRKVWEEYQKIKE